MKATLVLVLFLAGCRSPQPAEAPKVEYFKVDPANAGGIRGQVRFEGSAAKAKRISMDAEEACQQLHKEPVFEQVVVTGKSSGLANVFVYVKSGLEGKTFTPNPGTVVIEQKGCQFLPRVIGVRAGQTLAVKNSDPVSHNIHPVPKNNRDWNQQQPPGAADLKRKFGFPEVMIPVKCNVHAWMKSYIGVLEHPFFAVTGPDGEFQFDALPPGEYTVAAWHEQFGELTQSLTVERGRSTSTSFRFR